MMINDRVALHGCRQSSLGTCRWRPMIDIRVVVFKELLLFLVVRNLKWRPSVCHFTSNRQHPSPSPPSFNFAPHTWCGGSRKNLPVENWDWEGGPRPGGHFISGMRFETERDKQNPSARCRHPGLRAFPDFQAERFNQINISDTPWTLMRMPYSGPQYWCSWKFWIMYRRTSFIREGHDTAASSSRSKELGKSCMQ